jgi:outer membrane protein TolC
MSMGAAALVIVAVLSGMPLEGQRHSTPPALTLREAIAEALRASPGLRPARDAIELAEIQQRVADARYAVKFAPGFSAGHDAGGFGGRQLGMSVSKHLPIGTDVLFQASSAEYGAAGPGFRDTGYSVGISQPVLHAFGPARRAEREMPRRAVTSAERALATTRQDLVLQVASAYYAIVREERLLDVAARALERAGRLREASQARARVGLATQLDVMRADLLLSQSEAALGAQQEALEGARDALKVLLGRPLALPLHVDAMPAPLPAAHAAPVDVQRTIADALVRRVDLREARDRVADARLAESVARWSLLPDVNLTASFTKRGIGGGSASGLLDDAFGGWRFGVSTTYAIDRSTSEAAAAGAAIAAGAAARGVDDLEQAVAAQVRGSLRALRRSHEAIAIQEKAISVAERQLRLAELRYERGLADNFDVIDAETNLLQARSALIGSQVDFAMARLALDRATGALDPDEYLK